MFARVRKFGCAAVVAAVAASFACAGTAQAAQPWLPYNPTGYYLDLVNCCSSIATWPNTKLDANGIPMVTYDGGKTYVYNPVTIGNYGLQAYSWFLKYGNPQYQQNAVNAANWFVANQGPDGAWRYNFSYPVGGMGVTLPPGWPSAMAQGLAMSLLTRVASLTQTPSYLVAARAALGPLSQPVSSGGTLADFFGHPFYEEYPTSPPSFTLNGYMYTLVGLVDLNAADPSSGAGSLLDQGLATLDYALPFYDLTVSTAYHLGHITNPPRPVYTIPSYHTQHVMLLRALTSIRPDTIESFYAARWATYPPCSTSPLCAA